MFNFNPFAKKETMSPPAPQEVIKDVQADTSETEVLESAPVKEDPMAGLSLAEKAELLASQKENLEKLQGERLAYYKEAKNFEEKMASMGLSDERKKEVRDQIMAEGGEISSEIEKIRSEYGFKATPIEVYSMRMKMLQNEVDRIKENLNTKYRDVLQHVESHGFASFIKHPGAVHNQLLYLKEKFGEYPEVKTFIESVKSSNHDHYELDYNIFIKSINKQIEENCKYKTEGEVAEAQERIHRLNKLIGQNESELYDVKRNAGRFNKDYF